MSKKILIIIVLICTLFSISFMIYYDEIYYNYINGFNFTYTNTQETFRDIDKVIVEDNKDIDRNNEVNLEKNISKQVGNNINKEEKKDNNTYNTEVKEKDISNNKDVTYNNEKLIEDSISNKKNIIKIENIGNENQEEIKNYRNSKNNTRVFRIDKYSIVEKIPNKDKLKLIKIASGLSLNDYKNLSKHIKRSDELGAAIDIFTILKEKLSTKEYEELTMILNSYINLELIEKYIT